MPSGREHGPVYQPPRGLSGGMPMFLRSVSCSGAGTAREAWPDPANAATVSNMPPNWFRRGDDGWFLPPRFGQDSRVLKWVIQHIDGNAAATTKATGLVQVPGALDLTELTIDEADALDVDSEEWTAELRLIQESDLADLETRLQG